jgi:Mlc titration factor MtfA (ptsG expression regulator)
MDELKSDVILSLEQYAANEPIMRFFAVSSGFFYLATRIMELPRSAERTVALRKLLESKDAAVRAAL